MSKQMTEEDALDLLQDGRDAGLQWMIHRYTPYVSTIIRGIVGDRLTIQDAEEITADVFTELWLYRDRLQKGKVKGYLGAIARNQSIDFLRKKGAERPMPEFNEITISSDTPEQMILLQESKQILRKLLDTMNTTNREIFVRYYYYYEDTPSIARRMGMSPDAVRQRLARGRDYLRQLLTEERFE